MKKIEFGFNESAGSIWEGIGIKKGTMLLDADYYGAISFNGDNYIVAKVVDDEYNRYPGLLNKFIVRQALCDLYADGSAILLLNAEETESTMRLEHSLNNEGLKDKINSIEDIVGLSREIHGAPLAFTLIDLGKEVMATSIPEEAFNLKNEAIKHCHESIADLQMAKNNNYSLK